MQIIWKYFISIIFLFKSKNIETLTTVGFCCFGFGLVFLQFLLLNAYSFLLSKSLTSFIISVQFVRTVREVADKSITCRLSFSLWKYLLTLPCAAIFSVKLIDIVVVFRTVSDSSFLWKNDGGRLKGMEPLELL